MSTRSIVAEPYGDGWRGRYVHWDGYPEVKLNGLSRLVQRDGIEKVRQVLLHDNLSWSSITPDATGDFEKDGRNDGCVVGYGFVHNSDISREPFFTHDDTEFAWTKYLYILGDNAIFYSHALSSDSWSKPQEHRYEMSL